MTSTVNTTDLDLIKDPTSINKKIGTKSASESKLNNKPLQTSVNQRKTIFF